MKKKTKEEFIRQAREVHGDRYEYPGQYLGTHIKMDILCLTHGIFLQASGEHLRGKGCRQCCFDAQKSNKEVFVKQAREIHGNKYEYPDYNDYINADTKMNIRCPEHEMFQQTPYHHISRKQGCPQCGIQKRADTQRLGKDKFINKAREIHGNKYEYIGKYIDTHTKIDILCPIHGNFQQNPHSHTGINPSGCPKCSIIISRQETEWLDYLGIELRQYKIKIKNKNGNVINIKADGYDPLTKTVYEFHGDFWHGNPNVFTNPFEWNPRTKCQMFELYKKTIEKEQLLKKAGYNVVVIWESEWNSIRHSANYRSKIINTQTGV